MIDTFRKNDKLNYNDFLNKMQGKSWDNFKLRWGKLTHFTEINLKFTSKKNSSEISSKKFFVTVLLSLSA